MGVLNVRNDTIRAPPRSALSGEDRGHGQQDNIQRSRRTTISGAAMAVFQSSRNRPLEGVPEG